MKIIVYRSRCVNCDETFYGLKDERFLCPHCNRDAVGAIDEGLHASYAVLVEPRNGGLALIRV